MQMTDHSSNSAAQANKNGHSTAARIVTVPNILSVSRIVLLPIVLAYVSFGHYLVVIREQRRLPTGNAALLGATTALSTTALVPFATWLALRGLRTLSIRMAGHQAGVAAHAAATMVAACHRSQADRFRIDDRPGRAP